MIPVAPSSDTPSDKRYLRNFTLALLSFASVLLLVSSVYRAATVPFTHDESLSFAIYNWETNSADTANNHLLNTVLMRVFSLLIGNSELSLRLPNVLAHVLYLACTLLLLKRLRHPVLMAAGFVALNLNLFLLDFFFLARGYGLALAFLMLSLYLLTRAFEAKPAPAFEKYLILSVSAGAVAVLANLVFLHYYLPLLLVSGLLLLHEAKTSASRQSLKSTAIVLFSVSGIFLAFVFLNLFRLQRNGLLYFGGEVGFIRDTVSSVVHRSLYTIDYSYRTEKALVLSVVGLFVVLLVSGGYVFASHKEWSPFLLFLVILSVAIGLPIVEHHLVNTRFPIERTALYYVPLYAMALLSGLEVLVRLMNHRGMRMVVLMLTAIMAAVVSWHFYRGFDPHICLSWRYDMHNKEVLALINRDREVSFPGQMVSISNSWFMEPSLNFYRFTRRYNWLAPATQEHMNLDHSNYIYALERDVAELKAERYVRLATYSDTETALLRVIPLQGAPGAP